MRRKSRVSYLFFAFNFRWCCSGAADGIGAESAETITRTVCSMFRTKEDDADGACGRAG